MLCCGKILLAWWYQALQACRGMQPCEGCRLLPMVQLACISVAFIVDRFIVHLGQGGVQMWQPFAQHHHLESAGSAHFLLVCSRCGHVSRTWCIELQVDCVG